MSSKVQAGQTVNIINSNLEVEDWQDHIADIALEDTTFFSLSKKGEGKEEATTNRKFNWPEYREDEPVISVPLGATTASGKLTVPNTTNLQGLVKDYILVDANGNYLRLTDNPVVSGNNLELNLVTLGTADDDGFMTKETATTTTILDALKGTTLKKLYTSKPESNDDYNPVQRIVDNTHNYVGTFENYTQISMQKAAEIWRGEVTQREWQTGKEGQAHARDIERAFWVSEGYNNSTNRQAMKGFLNFSNVQAKSIAKADFDFMAFIEFCELQVMAYNKKEEITGYCNPSFLTAFSNLMLNANAKFNLTYDAIGSKDPFGLNVKTIVTPHVTINLRTSAFLKGHFGQTPVLACIDMDKTRVRYQSANGVNLNTKLTKGVQPNNANYFLDKIYSVLGLQLENAECHSFLKITA